MNNGFTTNNSSQSPKFRSFLESLRKHSMAEQKPKEDYASYFERYREEKKLEEQRKSEFFRARKREFNEVYSQTKRKEEQKIKELQKRLREMKKSMKKLKREVDVATTVQTDEVEVGVYHETMLDHLMKMVELMRKNIESSATWLHVFNMRSQKKGYYWGQAKRSGTKFTLSEERQIATAMG